MNSPRPNIVEQVILSKKELSNAMADNRCGCQYKNTFITTVWGKPEALLTRRELELLFRVYYVHKIEIMKANPDEHFYLVSELERYNWLVDKIEELYEIVLTDQHSQGELSNLIKYLSIMGWQINYNACVD